MRWYAVVRGRKTGIYDNLEDCKQQVDVFSNHHYRAFNHLGYAEAYIYDKLGYREYHRYTDGACKYNQSRRHAKAGYGVFVGPNDPRNRSGRVRGEQTNQRAELYAVYYALKCALRSMTTIFSYCTRHKLVIHTDSEYAINCLCTWIHKWRKNGYLNASGNPVANQDVIKACMDLVRQIREIDGEVCLRKVAAHSGNEFNDMADKLAQEGCFKD